MAKAWFPMIVRGADSVEFRAMWLPLTRVDYLATYTFFSGFFLFLFGKMVCTLQLLVGGGV